MPDKIKIDLKTWRVEKHGKGFVKIYNKLDQFTRVIREDKFKSDYEILGSKKKTNKKKGKEDE